MKEVKKIITVDKEKHDIVIQEFETFDELMTTVSATDILTTYNYRYQQLQCMEEKKRLKPRHITIKEKRAHAFNLFNEEELALTTKDAGKFETLLAQKLVKIEQMIKNKEII